MGPWIRTADELNRLADALRGSRRVAVDSESDSLYHQREKVCLIQVGTESGGLYLVDTLELTDLSPLAPVFADPGVLKVFHGADYDVTTIKRDFGFTFAGVFDTMLAARILGLPEVGLQAVLLRELGVTVTKESQTADWSRRPLPPVQEAYALADVTYLLALQERLEEKLRDAGRLAWVQEECEAVAAMEAGRRGRDPEGWLKMKGVRRLDRRRQGIARDLWAWRESLAESTDIPAFKLMSTETILALAEHPPADEAALGKVRGLTPRLRAQGAEILGVIQRAGARPESELPAPPAVNTRPNPTEATKRRIEALRAWRTKAGAQLAIDIAVVLPQRLLEKVAEAAPRRREDLLAIPGLRRWRVDALGDQMLAACKPRQAEIQ